MIFEVQASLTFEKNFQRITGSMNSNNWLSFPLSPTHPSLPAHLHASHPHQFSLGLVNDNMENPFQTQGTSLIISSSFLLLLGKL